MSSWPSLANPTMPVFDYAQVPAGMVEQRIAEPQPALRNLDTPLLEEAGLSTVTIRIDSKESDPYSFGWVLADNKWYMADANGVVKVPHQGSADIEIWAENHAIRVVDGQNMAQFPFIQRYRLPGNGGWLCPIGQQQHGFRVAKQTLQIYLTWRSKLGQSGWPKVMARLVYPAYLLFECLSEPKSIVVAGVNKPFDEKPLIHIIDHPQWETIERHIADEYAHALHFLELSVEQRHQITWSYFQWLVNERQSHGLEVRTTNVVAYCEAWDAFFTATVLRPTHPDSYYFSKTNLDTTFRDLVAKGKIPVADGWAWELCIAGLLHEVAAARGIQFAWERFAARSKATTFQESAAAWRAQEPSSFPWMQGLARKWRIIA